MTLLLQKFNGRAVVEGIYPVVTMNEVDELSFGGVWSYSPSCEPFFQEEEEKH